MNLDQLTASAFRRAPSAARGRITFIDPRTSRETTGEAVGTPARGASSDSFQAGIEVTEKHRRISVLKAGLAFAPRIGLQAEWEGTRWNVLGVAAVRPSGTTVYLYRVTLSR